MKRTIFQQLIYNILVPILVLLLILAFVNIRRNYSMLNNYSEEKKYIITEDLKKIIEFEDVAIEAIEENLTQQMKEISERLILDEFPKNNLKNLDLKALQKKYKTDFDFYIINNKGEIINTTFEQDLGFNLFQIDEKHKEFLLRIMHGNEFVSERLSIEKSTGLLKKYSYQPDQSNSYILEIGSYSPKATELLNAFKESLNAFTLDERINIDSVDLFINKEQLNSFNSNLKLKEKQAEFVKQVFDSKAEMDTLIKNKDQYLLYNYVYLERDETDLYEGSVIRIVRNITSDRKLIQRELFLFVSLFLLTLVIVGVLVYYRARFLTQPIKSLVEYVRNISTSNLDHRAEIKGSREIEILSEHFNTMMERLHSFYLDLEDKVRNRTIQLQKQTDELNLVNQQLEQLSIVARETDNAVIIMDAETNFQWVNEGFTRLFKMNLNELIEKRGKSLLESSDNDQVHDYYEKCLDIKRSVVYQSKFYLNEENFIWTQTTLTPIMDEKGEVKRLIAIDSNITKLKNAEEEITEQHKTVSIQKQKITDSIQYARRIQAAVLPPKSQVEKWFPNQFFFFKPRDIVSGDFYWFSEKDDKLIVAAVDCTGHGVPGGFMSMLGIAFLNEIVNRIAVNKHVFSLQASEILNQLREKVIDALHQTGRANEAKDGMDMSLVIIDMENKQMQFAGANNPLYLYRGNEVEVFKGDSMSISIDKRQERSFTNHEIQIQENDRIYLFSDGFVDQFGGDKGRKFKSKRFREYLLEIQHLSMEEQGVDIQDVFYDWKGSRSQIDDVLVIGLELTQQKQEVRSTVDWSNKKILIVEDTELNYVLLAEVLRNSKVKIIRALNGKEAVDLMRNSSDIDLVLMDINLPIMDGFEATTQIRKFNNEVPIIAQTALDIENAREQSLAVGCNDYFTKPIKFKEFMGTMKKYLQ